ncbi:MAG: hypothetical protein IPK57_08920 [Chitinophagaceae bacterium]|nr:hypothetical protein [Chitinophagaceae bacterium]
MLGDNEPVINGLINVYKLHPKSGQRLSATPVASLSVNTKGYWEHL